MLNLEIAILETDSAYAEKLSHYLITNKNHQFSVKLFSETAYLQKYLLNNSPDCLLTTEYLYLQLGETHQSKFTILLVDGLVNSQLIHLPCIDKYQKGEKILNKLLHHYAMSSTKEMLPQEQSNPCEIIGVYSPIGGSGKTSIALAFGKSMALLGKKVLFMSLEEIVSYKNLLDYEDDSSMSDLLYYVSKKADNLMMKIEGIQRQDQETGMRFIPPPIYSREMLDLSVEDLSELLEALVKHSSYEVILLDFTSGITEKNLSLLKRCHKWMLLLNPGPLQRNKISCFIRDYAEGLFSEKTFLVMNTNQLDGEEIVESVLGMKVAAQIPYKKDLFTYKGEKCRMNLDESFRQSLISVWEVMQQDGSIDD